MSKRRICSICKESFACRYYETHVLACATENSISSNFREQGDEEQNTTEFQNVETQNQEQADDEVPVNNINDEQSILEEEREDVEDHLTAQEFQEIIEEFELSDDESDEETDQQNSTFDNLVLWYMILLAVWQLTFNITDSALQSLLKIFNVFFSVLSKNIPAVSAISAIAPATLYIFHKKLTMDKITYEKYVVCTRCHSLYILEDCVTVYRGVKETKKCSFVKHPNHVNKGHRKQCGQDLLMTIVSPSDKRVLFPYKVYCYRKLEHSMRELLNRNKFEVDCETWRDREIHNNILEDVYDGKVWKSFKRGQDLFFNDKRNYGLMLNLDWFQPFKHSSYSVGAIYLVVLNLPRTERFKRKNVILLGIIPNMAKEPPTNTFLKPLISELNEAWINGFNLYSIESRKIENFKLALICVGCDIPACRKVCGFLSHAAKRGCSKCKKLFPGAVGERDYSGFDETLWEKRTTEEHREQMQEIILCRTEGDKQKLESLHGTRYSVLADLEYYDTVRFGIVDPMHNLYLGTAKHLIKIWKERQYFSKPKLIEMQNKIDKFVIPCDVGKIPRKIVSCFDEFNADEYKNWTLLFSIYALKGIIPKAELQCFRKFVLACQYLSTRVISKNDVVIAHNLFKQFCVSFEQLYGEDRVTPNMHLHLHLKECVLDYGPIYSFWLFSFERYNGNLGIIPNNRKNVECQIMKRFLRDNHTLNLELPNDYHIEFGIVVEKLLADKKQRGTLNETTIDLLQVSLLSSRFKSPINQIWENFPVRALSKTSIYSLEEVEHQYLEQTYKKLFPNFLWNQITIPFSTYRTNEVALAAEVFGSLFSRNKRSAYIIAYWAGSQGNIIDFNDLTVGPTPGVIEYFFKHSLIHGTQNLEQWFAKCRWFLPKTEAVKTKFGKPVEVWGHLFCNNGPASFIPVSRIHSKVVHSKSQIDGRTVTIVVPRLRYSNVT